MPWDEIASIAVTNQRETGMVWDSETGIPIYNAIVWQCPRAKEQCDQIAKDPKILEYIYQKPVFIFHLILQLLRFNGY